jgi:hypothetical protein
MRIFKPWIALPTWAGSKRRDGRAWVYNLFNRRCQLTPVPVGAGCARSSSSPCS